MRFNNARAVLAVVPAKYRPASDEKQWTHVETAKDLYRDKLAGQHAMFAARITEFKNESVRGVDMIRVVGGEVINENLSVGIAFTVAKPQGQELERLIELLTEARDKSRTIRFSGNITATDCLETAQKRKSRKSTVKVGTGSGTVGSRTEEYDAYVKKVLIEVNVESAGAVSK